MFYKNEIHIYIGKQCYSVIFCEYRPMPFRLHLLYHKSLKWFYNSHNYGSSQTFFKIKINLLEDANKKFKRFFGGILFFRLYMWNFINFNFPQIGLFGSKSNILRKHIVLLVESYTPRLFVNFFWISENGHQRLPQC